MKKQLLHISAEAAELIRKYHEVEDADDSIYFDSDLKRKRLLAAAETMVKSIAMVSPDNPSFEESARLASEIQAQCLAPDVAPVHPETKEQVYNSLLERLQPLLESELVGKCMRLKTGAYDFDVFKVTKVIARCGMHDFLKIYLDGNGFRYTVNPQKSDRSNWPSFTQVSAECTDLLITGKDRYDYKDRWLYIISEEEMAEEFTKRTADLAKLIGIDLNGA
jgi:hypothetical protein